MIIKRKYLTYLFVVVVLLLKKGFGQVTDLPPDHKDDYANEFIVPETIRENVDMFNYKGTEYLFVGSLTFTFEQAFWVCNQYFHGHLGWVKNLEVAFFLAEALSETNLDMETMWIAARSYIIAEKDDLIEWYWMKGINTSDEIIPMNVIHHFTVNPHILTEDRRCLGFGRNNHQEPDYRPITCAALRYVMCQRREGDSDGNTTHRGWIRLPPREYKIFSEKVTYNRAKSKCFEADPEAQLAVIISFEHSQKLGRYLLIGRPSLENAWIGAKWYEDHYAFEPEHLPLANASDTTGYPPWRNQTIIKTHGCVLLDRHIANITLFIEARCERLRPYICYRPLINKTEENNFHDVIIDADGYRLHYMPRPWRQARDYCKERYATYESKLVEITDKKGVSNLLYVMGENKTAVQHIWIAGRFNRSVEPPVWVWDSNDAVIPTDDSVLNWIKNESYQDNVEILNTCLNMDRENHIVALHYGTDCDAQQSFVCYFTADNLRKLQKDEEKPVNGTTE